MPSLRDSKLWWDYWYYLKPLPSGLWAEFHTVFPMVKPKQCTNAVPSPWNASVSLARFNQPLAGFFMPARRWHTFPVRHRNSVRWNSTALSGINDYEKAVPGGQKIIARGSPRLKPCSTPIAMICQLAGTAYFQSWYPLLPLPMLIQPLQSQLKALFRSAFYPGKAGFLILCIPFPFIQANSVVIAAGSFAM